VAATSSRRWVSIIFFTAITLADRNHARKWPK
jgi:hypothetical protein